MIKPFHEQIDKPELGRADKLNVLQVNVGRLCNLSCRHCHMDAGLNRTEIMTEATMQEVLRVLKAWNFKILDITGGAPEMNPNFQWLVDEGVKSGAHVMVRSNLVILQDEKYVELPEFFAERGVEIVASLPYYTERNCDIQRGTGTFKAVIAMLKKLNAIGYGRDEKLPLDLVYNPNGAFLPPDQNELEREYKSRLEADYGIKFTRLFAITNNPVGRFKKFLERTGNFDGYMERLYNAFNPAALEGMMCRFQLSVGWDGTLYDCDFNQAADLPADFKFNNIKINNIRDLPNEPVSREIKFGNHCYACTAGSGSSCGGATA